MIPHEFYAHQQRAMHWLHSHPRGILALEQGLGKTAVAIADCVYPAMVVPPAHGNIVWREEFARWAPERRVQVVRPDDSVDLDADAWIINYDILRRTAAPPGVQTLIADESHYLTNRDATRTQRLAAIGQRVPRVRLLSGTPMQRPIDLWTQLRMVGGTRLAYEDFGRHYCAGFLDEFYRWNFKGASHQDELRGLLARSMFRVTKDEALPDMPPKVWKVIPLDLPPGNERDYDLEAIARIGTPTPFEGLSELLRLQSAIKAPHVIRYLEDQLVHEKKIVIFCWHRDMVRTLRDHFTAELGPGSVVTYNSETPQRDKDVAQARFQAADGPRLFIGNIVSAGTALTLTAASLVVFAEGSWNPNQLEQAADRCHRIGQTQPVRVRILTINGSIDHQMVRRCLEKLRVIQHVVVPTHQEIDSMSENTNPNAAVADTFDKLAQALIAHAAGLTSFAKLYRAHPATVTTGEPAANDSTFDEPAAAAPPVKEKKGKPAPTRAEPAAAASDLTAKTVTEFAVAWIKEGASEPAQTATSAKVRAIVSKHGAAKISDLPVTSLAAVYAELQAAKAAGAAGQSDVIDI